jgi:hypothetical protein
MAKRTKTKRVTMVYDGPLQILHLPRLFESSENDIAKATEGSKAMRVTRWSKSQSFIMI